MQNKNHLHATDATGVFAKSSGDSLQIKALLVSILPLAWQVNSCGFGRWNVVKHLQFSRVFAHELYKGSTVFRVGTDAEWDFSVEEKSPRKMGTQIMKYQFPRPGPPTQHRNIKTYMESKEWDDADSWMFFWVSHPVGNTWHEFEIKASNKNETKFGMDSSTTIGAQKKGWNYQPLSIGRQPLRFRFQGFRRHETWWNPAQVGPGPLPSTGTVKKIRS